MGIGDDSPQKGYAFYVHQNPDNLHMYIGVSKNIKDRWSGEGIKYKSCPKIYAAFQKYGWDHFDHIVLFDGLTKEEAFAKEKAWIKAAKLAGISYNIADGGEGAPGVKLSQKQIEQIIERNTGRVCSEETRKKISASHKKLHNLDIKIYAFDRQTGEQVMSFSSIREAAKCVGIAHTSISSNAKNKVISAGGYIWDYTPIISKDDPRLLKSREIFAKAKVYCYDLQGQLVAVYPSAAAAAEAIGTRPDMIGTCCSKNRLSWKGYIWRRTEEPIEEDVLNRINKWRKIHETD